MSKLLYLTSSSYSGSTLFTFLINQHPEIFTIGELEGWDYGEEDYKCSCGELIEKCPFFLKVGDAIKSKRLPFKMNNFGTKLQFSNSKKINRYLTSALPVIRNSTVEKVRDIILKILPVFRSRYRSALKTNELFIDSALMYSGAEIFVDATKDPYRIRLMKDIPDVDIYIIYMTRDIRGVVASNVRKRQVSVEWATNHWLLEQENISRIISESTKTLHVYYEDLCKNPNITLSKIYKYVGASENMFEGSIREGEHHILGNMMRVTDVDEIKLDERWKDELSKEQVDVIEINMRNYLNKHPDSHAKNIITYYLNNCEVKAP